MSHVPEANGTFDIKVERYIYLLLKFFTFGVQTIISAFKEYKTLNDKLSPNINILQC